MTTSPSEPVENDQSGNDDADTIHDNSTGDSQEGSGGPGIQDSDLPEDLQPSEDNPLAVSPDEGSGGQGGTDASGGGPLEDSGDDGADQPTNDPTGGTPL
ncbi:MAG: hypothetical protein ACR2FP_08140 [Nocardioidaceae bacterium]